MAKGKALDGKSGSLLDMDTQKAVSMTWEEFTGAKAKRTRKSRYSDFVASLLPGDVVDATAEFPEANTGTLRSAISHQAKVAGVTVTTLLHTSGHLLVARVKE